MFIERNMKSVWLMLCSNIKMSSCLCNTPNLQTFVLVCINHALFEFCVAVDLHNSLLLQDYGCWFSWSDLKKYNSYYTSVCVCNLCKPFDFRFTVTFTAQFKWGVLSNIHLTNLGVILNIWQIIKQINWKKTKQSTWKVLVTELCLIC